MPVLLVSRPVEHRPVNHGWNRPKWSFRTNGLDRPLIDYTRKRLFLLLNAQMQPWRSTTIPLTIFRSISRKNWKIWEISVEVFFWSATGEAMTSRNQTVNTGGEVVRIRRAVIGRWWRNIYFRPNRRSWLVVDNEAITTASMTFRWRNHI